MDLRGIDMLITDITNFKDSAIYKHVKLVNNDTQTLTDEQFAVYLLGDLEKKDSQPSKITIENAHVLDTLVASADDTRIEIPTGCNKNICYDGIYDIWLHDCENVTSISVVFPKYNVEIPITEFKLQTNCSIQIPLAFLPDGNKVRHMFTKIEGHSTICVSYIPTIAIQYDTMVIKLNPDARCKVHISTLYYQKPYRTRLVLHESKFYVNGVPLTVRCGIVHKCPKHALKRGCTIS